MVRRFALAMLVALAAQAFTACGPRPLTRLDESAVRTHLDESLQASARRDAQALCALVAEEASVTLVFVRFSSSDRVQWSKAQYCDYLRHGYEEIPRDMALATQAQVDAIEIEPGGRSATVRANVRESAEVGGQRIEFNSRQTLTIGLIDGKARFTQIVARMAGPGI